MPSTKDARRSKSDEPVAENDSQIIPVNQSYPTNIEKQKVLIDPPAKILLNKDAESAKKSDKLNAENDCQIPVDESCPTHIEKQKVIESLHKNPDIQNENNTEMQRP